MLKRLVQGVLHRLGLHITTVRGRSDAFGTLADNFLGRRTIIPYGLYGFLRHETDFYNCYIANRDRVSLDHSHSQLGQDLWIAHLLRAEERRAKGEPGGFFVEFGGFDGKTYSNTYFLEKEFGWTGVLAEPIPAQFDACRRNRTCVVDNRCVWKRTGEILTFNVVEGANELGTIAEFAEKDIHAGMRTLQRSEIQVPTVSLADLLSEHSAPSVIDYVSIDTEGSELEILRAFPFERFHIRALSVEHNFTSQREEIRTLLEANGYFRLTRSVDYFDDIYLHADHFSKPELGGMR